MADVTPREAQRLPTLQNPCTLGVDVSTGRLFIAGLSDGVIQMTDTCYTDSVLHGVGHGKSDAEY